MDQIIRNQNSVNKMKYKCEVQGCPYGTNRSDNFKRHNLVHDKHKIECPSCMKLISPNSLKVHMNSIACMSVQPPLNDATPIEQQLNEAGPQPLVDVEEVKVVVTIKFDGYGNMTFSHSPIKFGGNDVWLVPQFVADRGKVLNLIYMNIDSSFSSLFLYR